MKISEIFNEKPMVYSFEVFPPKKTSKIDTIYDTLDGLCDLSPDYISVTYNAGGIDANNNGDSSTCDISSIIKNQYDIEPLAHLTCINSSKTDILKAMGCLKKHNVQNILALRGDINNDIEPKNDFAHANELAAFIKANDPDFSIAGACYPEGHSDCESIVDDILNLRLKVNDGTSHLITQLFFDNNAFYSFVERCRLAGINAPISAGIMPVVNKNQIERLVSLCGASLPQKFVKIINRYADNKEALRDAGIAYAVDQIVDLIANGAQGIHLYTMNQPYVAQQITRNIKNLLVG